MARVAEQKGKNELALHLLGELDVAAQSITLAQWTPELLFEVKSRRLRLLRMKATRSETDKSRLPARDGTASVRSDRARSGRQRGTVRIIRTEFIKESHTWQKVTIWYRVIKQPVAGE